MKKAFYLFGTICFMFALYRSIGELFHDINVCYKRLEHKSKEQEKGKVRQPIGFAVERIES